MAAKYAILARVKCMCGTVISIRVMGTTYGGSGSVPCWNCGRTVGFSGNLGFVIDHDGQRYSAPCTTQSWQIR